MTDSDSIHSFIYLVLLKYKFVLNVTLKQTLIIWYMIQQPSSQVAHALFDPYTEKEDNYRGQNNASFLFQV